MPNTISKLSHDCVYDNCEQMHTHNAHGFLLPMLSFKNESYEPCQMHMASKNSHNFNLRSGNFVYWILSMVYRLSELYWTSRTFVITRASATTAKFSQLLYHKLNWWCEVFIVFFKISLDWVMFFPQTTVECVQWLSDTN